MQHYKGVTTPLTHCTEAHRQKKGHTYHAQTTCLRLKSDTFTTIKHISSNSELTTMLLAADCKSG